MKRSTITIWAVLVSVILIQAAESRPWVPVANYATKTDSLYNGSTYTNGADILTTAGKIDTAAMAATDVRTFINNATALGASRTETGTRSFSDSVVVTGGTRLTGVNVTGAVSVGGAITTTSTQRFGTYGRAIKMIYAGQAAWTTDDLIDTIAFNVSSDLTATDCAIITSVSDTTLAKSVAVAISANGDTLFVTRPGGGASAAKYNYVIYDY